MAFIISSFMHMLTLNQESMTLLCECELIKKFYKISLHPEKYHRFVTGRSRSDYSLEQMIQTVANSSEELCDQLF